MTSVLEWISSAWNWLLNLNGFEGAAITASVAGLAYANGAWRTRRLASFKEVLVAEALFLHEQERSRPDGAEGATVESHLNPEPIPGMAWGRWQRFRNRWLQAKHLPFRIRHYGCALLLWSGSHHFNVVLIWVSATSRLQALNEVLARYGRRQMTPEEFDRIDKPGANIVLRLEHHGYLILEPALPRWRSRRHRKRAVERAPAAESDGGSPRPSSGDAEDYSSNRSGQTGSTP